MGNDGLHSIDYRLEDYRDYLVEIVFCQIHHRSSYASACIIDPDVHMTVFLQSKISQVLNLMPPGHVGPDDKGLRLACEATWFSSLSRLAASTRSWPFSPSRLAKAAPIPLLAPVITVTLPAMQIPFLCFSQTLRSFTVICSATFRTALFRGMLLSHSISFEEDFLCGWSLYARDSGWVVSCRRCPRAIRGRTEPEGPATMRRLSQRRRNQALRGRPDRKNRGLRAGQGLRGNRL